MSGRGEIQIPLSEFEDSHTIRLYTQVIRRPTNPFLNLNYSPPRGEYAKINFLLGNYVLEEYTCRYEFQSYKVFENQGSQNLLSLICAYDGILESFLELADCISECIPISKLNRIKDHPYLSYEPDRILVKCYADTALRLVLSSFSLVKCEPGDGTLQPPPPPPPPLPPVPPGTPLDGSNYPVSDPYEETPDDTEPFPGDITESQQPDDFPAGEECQQVFVTYKVDYVDSGINETFTEERGFWGPVEGVEVRFQAGLFRVGAISLGTISGGACRSRNYYVTVSLSSTTTEATVEVLSVEVL